MTKTVSRLAEYVSALTIFLVLAGVLRAQEAENRVEYKVTKETQRLEMVVNTSRILTLDKEVPRAMVNNPDIVRVVPLSPSKVQLSALKPGVTQVNLWDEDGTLYTVNLIIMGDAQELEMLLQTEFPQASLRSPAAGDQRRAFGPRRSLGRSEPHRADGRGLLSQGDQQHHRGWCAAGDVARPGDGSVADQAAGAGI